jgi:protein-tyrosine phosphatase
VPYVDVHCHLLPGLDDGAVALRDSVAHARRLEIEGVREVVCTPHIKRNDFPGVHVGEIAARTRVAQQAVREGGLRLRLHPGGELAHPDALVLAPEDLARIAQGPAGARWVLLECPFAGLDHSFLDACRRLSRLGYGVLLAHPERTRGIGPADLRGLRRLLDLGALAQVNVCSLLGAHGPGAEHTARRLVRSGLAFCLASDGHPGTREQTLRRGRELLLRAGVSPARARSLTQVNPYRLLRLGMSRMTVPPALAAGRPVNWSVPAA